MKQNNRKITWKAIVAVMLVMATLMSLTAVVNAGIVETILGDEGIEIMSSSSKSPYTNHYVVVEYWPNGNIKTIINQRVDSTTGDYIDDKLWEVPYPETGEGSMAPYGSGLENAFKGCRCPRCK